MNPCCRRGMAGWWMPESFHPIDRIMESCLINVRHENNNDFKLITLMMFVSFACASAFAMVPETTTEASRISARHEKLQQQQNRHPLALGGFIATWRVLTRSRLFVTLTVLIMAVGLAQEGLQDLLLQYLQLKVPMMPRCTISSSSLPLSASSSSLASYPS